MGNPTSIRLRLDGGDPFEVPVSVFDNMGWHNARRAQSRFLTHSGRERRSSSRLVPIGKPGELSNLAELFGTPIQTNFDNCKRDYWSSPPTYIPVVAQRERLSRVLVYSAYQEEDSTVSSGVWTTAVDAPKIDGTFEMQATCYSGSVAGPH